MTTFPLDYIERVDLSDFQSKRVKITLKMDIHRFYDFKVEPIDDENLDVNLSKMTLKDSTSECKATLCFGPPNFSIFVEVGGKQQMIKDSDGKSIFLAKLV